MATWVEHQQQQNGSKDVDEEACMYAMQLSSMVVLPMTLRVAVELGILEQIQAGGPDSYLTAEDLAARLGNSNPLAPVMIERILRLLTSYSILNFTDTVDGEGRTVRSYGAAHVCKYLTPNQDGVSMAPLVLMNTDKVLMESWYHMKDAVTNGGIPFNLAYGMTAFEYHGKDLRFNKVFNEGMKNNSIIITKKILERYKRFEDVNVLIDVGGGIGGTISMITAKYPHIHGINFDLPHVVSEAPPFQGVEHVGGNMFESVPIGDAIFIKWILHDWSDEHCLKLLRNCAKSLPDKGKVIVVECILPDAPLVTPEAEGVFHLDMIMLAHNPGGKERTKKEFKELAMLSGFSNFKALFSYANVWVMEFNK
ncbi:hypothetical protein HPP92_015213 [Vanilla planifolia]|uniref:Caffeic acid O-methyltransferase n=1 Tax=Vanilla planifolia TaxID=51239 RepID=Q6Q796_VANPL|nr:caffeic acid O-methyltransferase [Vanilla planifolia]KAG0473356.1 hypothetical protein HPP92_015213 [Vanilla planifolia]